MTKESTAICLSCRRKAMSMTRSWRRIASPLYQSDIGILQSRLSHRNTAYEHPLAFQHFENRCDNLSSGGRLNPKELPLFLHLYRERVDSFHRLDLFNERRRRAKHFYFHNREI